MLKKKKLGQFSKNYKTFTPKFVTNLSKNMGLGTGIRKNLGVKKAPDPGSGSATLVTVHLQARNLKSIKPHERLLKIFSFQKCSSLGKYKSFLCLSLFFNG
jgi:hypothetical protein